MNFFIFFLSALAISVNAFSPLSSRLSTKSLDSIHLNMIPENSFVVAELYASPAATYNGELISETLKAVPRTVVEQKPAGYEYGAVNSDYTPVLAVGLVLSLVLGAAIPGFLSIGESAQSQQREREQENKIGDNIFAKKARQEKKDAIKKK